MDYEIYGARELITIINKLEEELTQTYEEQGLTRSDAQGAVEALVRQAT